MVEQGKNTEAPQRKRAANQEAGDKAEQRKNTEASQRKRAANQEAGDKAEQGKNTEARQRKRAEIREGAKTGIRPWASARLRLSAPPKELRAAQLLRQTSRSCALL